MQLTRREKVFIAIFIVVSAAAVYYVFFYQPLVKDIEAMSVQVTEGGDPPLLIKSKEQLASLPARVPGAFDESIGHAGELANGLTTSRAWWCIYMRFFKPLQMQQVEFGGDGAACRLCLMPVNVTFTYV